MSNLAILLIKNSELETADTANGAFFILLFILWVLVVGPGRVGGLPPGGGASLFNLVYLAGFEQVANLVLGPVNRVRRRLDQQSAIYELFFSFQRFVRRVAFVKPFINGVGLIFVQIRIVLP